MKTLKKTILITLLSLVMVGFSQCSTTKKIQENAPFEISEIYYQRWASGIREGGAGFNLFITINDTQAQLDSVYFRGKASLLRTNEQNPNLYTGRIVTTPEVRHDIIMSSDKNAEYGNKLPPANETIPFELDYHECVISYKEGNKTKYFKVKNIKERPVKEFPM